MPITRRTGRIVQAGGVLSAPGGPVLPIEVNAMIGQYLGNTTLERVRKYAQLMRNVDPANRERLRTLLFHNDDAVTFLLTVPRDRRWRTFLELCRSPTISEGDLLRTAKTLYEVSHQSVNGVIELVDHLTYYVGVSEDIIAALSRSRPRLAQFFFWRPIMTGAVSEALLDHLMRRGRIAEIDYFAQNGFQNRRYCYRWFGDRAPDIQRDVPLPRQTLAWLFAAGETSELKRIVQERYASKLIQEDVLWAWKSGFDVASVWYYVWPEIDWAKWIPELRHHPLALERVENILDDFTAAVEGVSLAPHDAPDLPADFRDPLDTDDPGEWYRENEDDAQALMYASNELVNVLEDELSLSQQAGETALRLLWRDFSHFRYFGLFIQELADPLRSLLELIRKGGIEGIITDYGRAVVKTIEESPLRDARASRDLIACGNELKRELRDLWEKYELYASLLQ